MAQSFLSVPERKRSGDYECGQFGGAAGTGQIAVVPHGELFQVTDEMAKLKVKVKV